MTKRKDRPKGFIVFYTKTHSVCLLIDSITVVSKGVSGDKTRVETKEGGTFLVDYSFDDFLTLLREAQDAD